MATLGDWRLITERLAKSLRSGAKADWREFCILCTSLSKLIDNAAVKNQSLPLFNDLSQLLKKVCERKDDLRFQPAIMVLLLSVKNVLHLGWFTDTEKQELRLVAQELMQHFTGNGGLAAIDIAGASHLIITRIMPRFYPRIKLHQVVFAFEMKQGYETSIYDFYLKSKPPVHEQLRLFVIQKDNIDTSTCLVTPPHANFLVNGKGVERRCIVSMDTGPQMPTDITGMLKIGINMMQVVGEFPGPYIVALAVTGTVVDLDSPLNLQPYHPVSMGLISDDDIIEGPSRISLRCPISHKRIVTPVKGADCKHHQCFDYDSFMEINCRRPAWRCPCCNRHVGFPDLCLDLKMVKVLKEVGDSVLDVMISEDGSWEAFLPEDDMAGLHSGRKNTSTSLGREGSPEDGEILPEAHGMVIDLCGEDETVNETSGSRPLHSSFDLKRSSSNGPISETEDIKPDVRAINANVISHPASGQSNLSLLSRGIPVRQDSGRTGTLEPVLTTSSFVPVLTDSVVSADHMGSLEGIREHTLSTTMDAFGHFGSSSPRSNEISAFHLLQAMMPEGTGAGPVVNSEALLERQLNRELSRTPIAIQALPAQTHLASLNNTRSRLNITPHPSSPSRPISAMHNSSSNQGPFYIGNHRPMVSSPNLATAPILAMDIGSGAAHETQPQFFSTVQHQSLHDSQLQSHVQSQFTEQVQPVQERPRIVHQVPSIRTPQTIQPSQRHPSEQQNVSQNVSTIRNTHQNRSDHQALHQQSFLHPQATRHPMQNINDATLWQQVQLSTVQLQQLQQAHLNLCSNQNMSSREDNLTQAQAGNLTAGLMEGTPLINRPSAVPTGIGSGRRQPVQGIRSVASQNLQRNNSFLIPNSTTGSYLGENRWVVSSHASTLAMEGAAVLSTEQRNRPVVRMRGSITTAGRVATSTPLINLSQAGSGHYNLLYGLSTQSASMVSPPAGTSNLSSRLSSSLTSPWIGDPARHWGTGSTNIVQNVAICNSVATSSQNSQAVGLDVNWIENQLDFPLSLPSQSQGTQNNSGIGSNRFGITRFEPF